MVSAGFLNIERELKSTIESEINRLGIMYRLFSRVKDKGSIDEKKSRKSYSKDGKKMQDIFGFRLITYFNDDVPLLFTTLKGMFEIDNEEYDKPESNQFEPLRKNLVCKLPQDLKRTFIELQQADPELEIVDDTFEIQFRTTLSEGWHEVEHNMRYKCKSEWDSFKQENRMMNGIYASLEASDYTLKSIFDELAFQNYKTKKWEAMLRNKFRLRFKLTPLSQGISDILDETPDIAKTIFKMNRIELLDQISNSKLVIQYSLDNIVYLVNHLKIKDDKLFDLTPTILKDQFQSNFQNNSVTEII